MIDSEGFKEWLKNNTTYSDRVIKDNVCRLKRADNILTWNDDESYLFYLDKEDAFKQLSMSVKSQLRKAVKLYTEYLKDNK